MNFIKTPNFIPISIFAAGITLFSAACGTLSESRLDQTLKARGTFLCPPKVLALPSAIDKSSLQARCYRDSVVINESAAEWSRAFYSEKDCTGVTIGYADWHAALLQEDPSKVAAMKPSNDTQQFSTHYSAVQSRRLIRSTPDWIAEGLAGCDLRKVAVNQPIPIAYGSSCSSLLPKVESDDQRNLVFRAGPKDGARELHGFWEQEATVCTR